MRNIPDTQHGFGIGRKNNRRVVEMGNGKITHRAVVFQTPSQFTVFHVPNDQFIHHREADRIRAIGRF